MKLFVFIARLEEKSKKDNLNNAVKTIAKKLKVYFKPHRVIIKPKEKEKVVLRPVISVYGSLLVPEGRFRQIATLAGGFTIKAGVENLLFKNSVLQIEGGYHPFAQTQGDVEDFSTAYLSLLAGYSFEVYPHLRITPLIGTGCQFHYINDTLVGGMRYYDPLISFQCDVDYSFYKSLAVSFLPSYGLFFEKGRTGHYMRFDLGMKYRFR